MSQIPSTSASGTSFDTIFAAALKEYKKKTKRDIASHPLATQLQSCDSPSAILAVLKDQAQTFAMSQSPDERLTKWLDPTVNVLYAFSASIGGPVELVFPPASAIFAGIGVLLQATKDVRASQDALIELFSRMEYFFRRLEMYIKVRPTAAMMDVIVKIMVEVLSILGIVTKEIAQGRTSTSFRLDIFPTVDLRAEKYIKRLTGRNDFEDALKRLDQLTQEEARMAAAEMLRFTHSIDDNVKGVIERMKNSGVAIREVEIKWKQMEQDIRNWFSPPDPSTNHNAACVVKNNIPPTWFFEAGIFKGWMSNGSLLWVHGKPGSGKTVLSAAIIQHIMSLRDNGSASLAYFYFDFRDEQKQNVRKAVTSLLIQLSAYSLPCCDIIHRLFSAHGKGTQQPSIGILIDCLKEMITVMAQQHPAFIVMDALDECPDDGIPTPREQVLKLVKDLVSLQLPNLRICLSSCPEIGIQTILKPLAVHAISLHDETGHNAVIASYVSAVVSSDARMRRWRDEDRSLVVEGLSERADGMFRLVFCQLETLRHAHPQYVRTILAELPVTLDGAYERVLNNINENDRDHARCLLHCLAVAVRPLRIEELAEILTFDLDAAQDGIPEFHADRRPKDQEEVVLSICSSLITVVGNRGSRVVQFSHFSIKEFLTSNRLAASAAPLSAYHILPGPAHTIVTQLCLGLLLHSDGSNSNSLRGSPLADYASQHWTAHAQFEDVASRVEDGMKALFDAEKPYFAAWISLYDIDARLGGRLPSEIPSPLYYAALCGFHSLVRHLIIKCPQDVNASGGSYGLPLIAALRNNHFQVAELLVEHGGSFGIQDVQMWGEHMHGATAATTSPTWPHLQVQVRLG
ncbi:hypothetical protein V8E53_000704 [Lactarius tabidus]